MPEPLSYAPGAPCWTNLHTPDPGTAERFYTAVFGWEYEHVGPSSDRYTYATSRRHMVAGITPDTDADTASWILSFATDSADAVAGRVVRAGGEVREGPADVGVLGRSVSALDSCGAHVGFWQPRAHMGAGLFNETSALCWAELAVHDTQVADAFYRAVLGLRAGRHAAAGEEHYAAFHLESGEAVAGRTLLPPDREGAEPFWMPYFGVHDAQDAVDTAVREKASVLHSGTNSAGQGLAVLADPSGAVFAVLELPATG
ncbi:MULTISPECIES: VOC family protein [unclassified Streptomyces]|uniref:VOC family protein n=1 Tax=unclassified Streptomyces TaxID=2593676 RepID=UPI002DDB0458|nr:MULTISPECIES: VOC family protein [unclassified Streptomyces]WSA90898.1 VOC family protein [Streptomyces sp. NBC_01795]WSB75221.1 VOC family protein [Streptomyces sp. NBC_01775]WSS45313.1 VOC family protein [Streptomyces sp. NBC_01187]